uniref:Uncharacterized protein n=2 Tax=Timema TaxID=61471 RepID=A0A7R9P1V7_9NEOP|nr:unnamed protein product [Timema bartmani]CAD7464663.1 unnamed protein product [Timema tahoe]
MDCNDYGDSSCVSSTWQHWKLQKPYLPSINVHRP